MWKPRNIAPAIEKVFATDNAVKNQDASPAAAVLRVAARSISFFSLGAADVLGAAAAAADASFPSSTSVVVDPVARQLCTLAPVDAAITTAAFGAYMLRV